MIWRWFLRNKLGVAGVAALGIACFTIADAFRDRAQLRRDLDLADRNLAAAHAEIAQAAETARVHRAHLDRAKAEARHWQALSNDLQSMEGRNAPLSPLLAATAERLFRAGQ